MFIVTVQVDAPMLEAQAVKEQIAMDLERFGDTKVLKVEQVGGGRRQMGFDDYRYNNSKR